MLLIKQQQCRETLPKMTWITYIYILAGESITSKDKFKARKHKEATCNLSGQVQGGQEPVTYQDGQPRN